VTELGDFVILLPFESKVNTEPNNFDLKAAPISMVQQS